MAVKNVGGEVFIRTNGKNCHLIESKPLSLSNSSEDSSVPPMIGNEM